MGIIKSLELRMFEFETERAPLVFAQEQNTNQKKQKIFAKIALAIAGAIAFACIVSYGFSGHESWITNKTPNVLKVIPVINLMTDMKAKKDNALSQINQIKFRSDSIDGIAKLMNNKQSADLMSKTNLTSTNIISKAWKQNIAEDKSLTEEDLKIAKTLLFLMENYQTLRKNSYAFNKLSNKESEIVLAEQKEWFYKNWNQIKEGINNKNELKNQIDLEEVMMKSLNLVDLPKGKNMIKKFLALKKTNPDMAKILFCKGVARFPK